MSDFMTDEKLRENIKNNLLALRKARGLTQVDISILTGKASPSVASWEQGKSLPDLATLYKLAKYYGKPLEYLYEHETGKEGAE